jgi:hypothetical protein
VASEDDGAHGGGGGGGGGGGDGEEEGVGEEREEEREKEEEEAEKAEGHDEAAAMEFADRLCSDMAYGTPLFFSYTLTLHFTPILNRCQVREGDSVSR